MKNLAKALSKYLCCGAATAGLTAPVTYLTTRENIEEKEEFKAILKQVEEQEEKQKALNTKIKDSETKISKLKGCVNSAKAVEHFKKDYRTGGMKKEVKVWFDNTTNCDY